MKKQKPLRNSLSILTVAVLVIMSFVPEILQGLMYAIAFAVWLIIVVERHILPHLKKKMDDEQRDEADTDDEIDIIDNGDSQSDEKRSWIWLDEYDKKE